jgi:hypothetical protein
MWVAAIPTAKVATTYVIEIKGVAARFKVSTAIAENVVKPPSTPVTTKCRRVSLFIIAGELATKPISKAPMTLTINVDHGKEVSLGV